MRRVALSSAIALCVALLAPVDAHSALLTTNINYNVTSTSDNVTRAATAVVTRRDDLGADRRPVVVVMPGWGGVGDIAGAQDGYAITFANAGYIAVNIGMHQTGDAPGNPPAFFYSDLAESAKAGLDAVCGQAYVNCAAIVLTGGSYGGTQTHSVLRFLRANGTYDGSGGGNAGRKVVAFLGQDSGYTLHYDNPVNADATQYSVAMIENQGDEAFPIDSCDYDNCGARNRGDYHQGAPGSQYVLSYCPAGGFHGARNYANWDAWVLSAIKTMVHNHRGIAKFAGYVEPNIAVSNACVTNAPVGVDLAISQSATPSPGSTGKDVIYTLTASNASGQAATSVQIMDLTPAGTTFIWASPGCSNAAGTVTCALGTLAGGASKSVKVVVRPASAGSKNNNVSVSAAEADPNPGNNASAAAITVNTSPAAAQAVRYRLYSDVTKEHHFTTDLNEYNVLGSFVGTWVQEGPVGKVLNNPGSFGGVTAAPYYRLYDTATRWHHWTTDANEYYTLSMVYAGWNAEGVDGYILPTQAAGSIALYRLNYPALGSLHHWTIDANEYNTLITSYGWVGEGGSGFVIQ